MPPACPFSVQFAREDSLRRVQGRRQGQTANMHPAIRSFMLMTGAALAIAAACPAYAAGDTGAQLLGALESYRDALVRAARWIEAGYARSPAVVIGLGATFLLPVLVVLGRWVHRQQHATAPSVQASELIGPPQLIEIEGAVPIELPRGRHLLQIGRHRDNDICIPDDTVSRYHAVIERSGDNHLVITDVSSPDGGGLLVNGERCLRAPIAAGDTVELGRAKLRFAAAM